MARAALLSDRAWAERKTSVLPEAWQKKTMSAWVDASRPYAAKVLHGGRWMTSEDVESYEGNAMVRDVVESLRGSALPIAANDSDVVERAEFVASECKILTFEFIDRVMRVDGVWLTKEQLIERGGEAWWTPLKIELRAMAIANGVTAIFDRKRRGATMFGGFARMMCGKWWRRQLRAQHAMAVELAAIRMGFVSKHKEVYASNETCRRREQQNNRNKATLERTRMVNEDGQEFTLAELAARSTASRPLRRAELMTRIAGFEFIARELGHDGLFGTLTCPSRMHKFKTVAKGAKVIPNDKYDGTSPREAQQHLADAWAKIRAELARLEVPVYGFRIAEPNHDGTPHWHFLLFMGGVGGDEKRRAIHRVAVVCRHYALEGDIRKEPTLRAFAEPYIAAWKRGEYRFKYEAMDAARVAFVTALHSWRVAERKLRNNGERGAKMHRFKPVMIDWSKGTAAGYIAKYVAKNIDGMYVEKDLLGNDALHTAGRVEAWATTWRVRQFQQIGGAPVTVWRELRRIKELPENAPDQLERAYLACNKIEAAEGVEAKAASFAEYLKAQGGVFVGRNYLIRLETELSEQEGGYGEPIGARPIGVRFVGKVLEAVGALGAVAVRSIEFLVRSVRHVWRVLGSDLRREASPWTRVNNCTGDTQEIERERRDLAEDFERTAKKNPPPWLLDGGGGCFA